MHLVMAATAGDYLGRCFMCVTQNVQFDFFTGASTLSNINSQDNYYCTLDRSCETQDKQWYSCERGVSTCLLFDATAEHLMSRYVDDHQSAAEQEE